MPTNETLAENKSYEDGFSKFKEFWTEANNIFPDSLTKAMDENAVIKYLLTLKDPREYIVELADIDPKLSEITAEFIDLIYDVGEIQNLFLGFKPCIFGNRIAHKYRALLNKYGYETIGYYTFDADKVISVVANNKDLFKSYIKADGAIDVDLLIVDIATSDLCSEMDLERGLVLGYPYEETKIYSKFIAFKKEVKKELEKKFGKNSKELKDFISETDKYNDANIDLIILLANLVDIRIDEEVKNYILNRENKNIFGFTWIGTNNDSEEAIQKRQSILEAFAAVEYKEFTSQINIGIILLMRESLEKLKLPIN